MSMPADTPAAVTQFGDRRSDEDDRPGASGPHRGQVGACQLRPPKYVDFKQLLGSVGRLVLHGAGLADAGIVDQRVDARQGFGDRLNRSPIAVVEWEVGDPVDTVIGPNGVRCTRAAEQRPAAGAEFTRRRPADSRRRSGAEHRPFVPGAALGTGYRHCRGSAGAKNGAASARNPAGSDENGT
jgi:hypothetical protein